MLRMLSKGVAVRASEKVETTKSGIIITQDREQSPLNRGEVIYVASDCDQVKVGDYVIYVEGTYWRNNVRKNGDEFNVDGEDLILLKEHEIKAIIEE